MPAADRLARDRAAEPAAKGGHGADLRGQDVAAEDATAQGRYGKLFPGLKAAPLDDPTIDELVRVLKRQSKAAPLEKGNKFPVVAFDFAALAAPLGVPAAPPEIISEGVPAGVTYFGQFVDHDITFDPTPILESSRDPRALVDFRTPRFDLDSVYGTGPADQPYLYDWREYAVEGVKLLVDRNTAGKQPFHDLPRNRQGRALIGDPRNDEHVIIAQLHLLFIRFHNAVVEYLRDEVHVPDEDLFATARRVVRWHYQWIVTHEFLRLIVGEAMLSSVLVAGEPGEAPSTRFECYRPKGRPFIPLEFSAATFRFGHSMVRDTYFVNGTTSNLPVVDDQPPDALNPSLSGQRFLTEELVIEWKRFFPLTDQGLKDRDLQFARELNPTISPPLFALPHGGQSLPRLNLERGRKVGLPSGQMVAHKLHCDVVSDEALLLPVVKAAFRERIKEATPLWYYMLCEAAASPQDGRRLGPVAGRIVTEVLVGLLVGDPESYIHRAAPPWTPHLGPAPDDFTMVDLVRIAQQGKIEPGAVQDYPG
jgi:hypothetical protein